MGRTGRLGGAFWVNRNAQTAGSTQVKLGQEGTPRATLVALSGAGSKGKVDRTKGSDVTGMELALRFMSVEPLSGTSLFNMKAT